MSRHSRFIAAILCVLFALTSLCTFTVFADLDDQGGGADNADPNGVSQGGGDYNQGGDDNQGGGDQGGGDYNQGGDDNQGGGDQGGGDYNQGGDDNQGGGDQGGGDYNQGGGDNQGSVDYNQGGNDNQGGGNDNGGDSGNSSGNDNNYSGGDTYYGNDGKEYSSPDDVYVGGDQTYIPPSETPSTTPEMYDTSKTKVDEKTLTNSDWDTIKAKLGGSKPAEIKEGVIDFSKYQDTDVSEDNNGQWILILGIALTILSIAGFTYFTVVTVKRRKNAATVKAGGSRIASSSGNHAAQKGGRYRENSDYDDNFDSGSKKPGKVKAEKTKNNKPKNGTRYK